ncbi:MAG: thiamine pyrophosphate-requiring protein [Pantoea sp.]|uniref:thiamine pyrophosphate-requiring protein n=1 Tax=Pantoea sp. TaxID=69393 RepID=UPI0023886B8C|nr:thiamine pyrophosphate-requiring protein [Pantoea sp.]MDE1186867.1 thiamine pyrophosphate-requiring protein [Pantoea sp.]
MSAPEQPAPAHSASGGWCELPSGSDAGDALVAAMAHGGVDYLFFTSGSEIGFYQEAIAKARALGKPAPRLITVTHEHASLNAALGYAAVSGRPAATAAHVDAGTLHHGGALHTALHANLPVLITAGFPPTSPSGTSAAARNAGGHLWLQENYDQHAIVRQYVKWDHRLQAHDNPGLTVSRALQVALSEPRGPAYLSVAPEVSMRPAAALRFPDAAALGITRSASPDPAGVQEIARRLAAAREPRIVVSGSGRDTRTVAALVALCEALALPVAHSATRRYLSFPMDHPLMMADTDLSRADVVLAIDADVPWVPGPQAPGADAWVAVISHDPIQLKIPTYEFTAHMRLAADPLPAIEAIGEAVRGIVTPGDAQRLAQRARRVGEANRAARATLKEQARAASSHAPIDPLWLGSQIADFVDDDAIVFDDTLPHNRLYEMLDCRRPGSYFFTPGTSGGWAPGAAFGAKLAAPGRDVIAVTGDGFYMFGTATAALWSARHYNAPFLTVVYQNRSWGTGTRRMAALYPNGYAQQGGFDGGYFDPPMDFTKEAQAAGAYGETVHDPLLIMDALRRGLDQVRKGRPAVISVWLARHLLAD